jgi:hypothetical protein
VWGTLPHFVRTDLLRRTVNKRCCETERERYEIRNSEFAPLALLFVSLDSTNHFERYIIRQLGYLLPERIIPGVRNQII